uniref:Tyrosine-protein kinase n=1 Tax=Parascaris univalens TaxID=6257 RepID=A0A914ZMX5_PARUN
MMLNENADMESVKSFLAEARLLRKLNHPNILRSYGIIVTAKPVAMLLELCQSSFCFVVFVAIDRGSIFCGVVLDT